MFSPDQIERIDHAASPRGSLDLHRRRSLPLDDAGAPLGALDQGAAAAEPPPPHGGPHFAEPPAGARSGGGSGSGAASAADLHHPLASYAAGGGGRAAYGSQVPLLSASDAAAIAAEEGAAPLPHILTAPPHNGGRKGSSGGGGGAAAGGARVAGGKAPKKKGSTVSHVRNWLRIDEHGETSMIQADKYKLTHKLGVQGRDLRLLDPSLATTYPSAILCREKALVVNLEHIKARDRVLCAQTRLLV